MAAQLSLGSLRWSSAAPADALVALGDDPSGNLTILRLPKAAGSMPTSVQSGVKRNFMNHSAEIGIDLRCQGGLSGELAASHLRKGISYV